MMIQMPSDYLDLDDIDDRDEDALTRDEALLWLNDRLGEPVRVAVEIARGDWNSEVVAGEGNLAHWSENHRNSLRPLSPDLAGWYVVGDTHFDLTHLDRSAIRLHGEDETSIELGEDVSLRIILVDG